MPPQLTLDKRTTRLIFIAFVLLTGLTAHRLFFAELPHGSRVLVIDGETIVHHQPPTWNVIEGKIEELFDWLEAGKA